MSDKEVAVAIKSLATARADVATSLRALDLVNQGASSETIRPLPPGLAEAAANLLSSLRHNITTLALAFKPPLTAAGITRYLDKSTDEVSRLVSCVVAAAAEGNNKSVLVEEWRAGVEEVGREVERLLNVLEDGVRAGVSTGESSASESPYLAHTGIVWDAIDRLKVRLPVDEQGAVVLRWKGMEETVRDAWTEFKEMLEDADEEDEDEDEQEFGLGDGDEEWAELEKAMNASMNSAEKKRAEAAKRLLSLHQILHLTTSRFIPHLQHDPEQPYTAFLAAGSDLVAAFDVAISSMYPRQDVAEILSGINALNERGRALVHELRDRVQTSVADQAKKDLVTTFVQRWHEQLNKEVAAWEEAKLGMAELANALE